jgi:hypothetical protein
MENEKFAYKTDFCHDGKQYNIRVVDEEDGHSVQVYQGNKSYENPILISHAMKMEFDNFLVNRYFTDTFEKWTANLPKDKDLNYVYGDFKIQMSHLNKQRDKFFFKFFAEYLKNMIINELA